ncbi:MAG: SAM-dependent methyltransferase [Actinomycetota bacterium]|nr:SAM-dependent methyltransferase [Actinomycetota bacterium]
MRPTTAAASGMPTVCDPPWSSTVRREPARSAGVGFDVRRQSAESPTVAGSLRQDLRERMGSSGPLPFVDFMQAALYHPSDGYYATRVPGHGSHYRTSPSLTPWFGRLVAREFRRMWQAIGEPDPFWVVEVGAGQGDLAADAMEETDAMGVPLRWRFIERFDRVRDWQRRRLGPAAGSAEWLTDLAGPPVAGCVLANEVLDNFPVHVLEVAEAGRVQEIYVDVDGDSFVERLGALSDVTLAEPAREAAAHLAPGARFEISSGVEAWCRNASQALTRGYLLLIDYGGLEPDIWLEHPRGTVATYRREDATPSPLDEPGSKDITADVNFSAVARAAQSAGFRPEPVITQSSWLLSLGIARVAEELETAGFMAALEGLVEEATVLQDELGRLIQLGDAGGLGNLLVLRAAKDAPTPC